MRALLRAEVRHVASALLCRDDELLLVPPGDSPAAGYTVPPGGSVQRSGFPAQGLLREIRADTGIHILGAGMPALVVRLDNPPHGFQATARMFEADSWHEDTARQGNATPQRIACLPGRAG